MKKKNITKLTILMIVVPYFTVLPQITFAEETESSIESTDANEETTQLSEEQIQQIEEEFSIPTLKKNQKKETIFEAEEIKIGPKTLAETREDDRLTYDAYNVVFALGSDQLGSGYSQPGLDIYFKKGTTVKLDGQTVGNEDYSVNYVQTPNTDNIKRRTSMDMLVIVTHDRELESKSGWADYSVDYGRSIVFGSDASDRSSGAYTYHVFEKNSGAMTASNATGSRSDMINANYQNRDFYSVEVFRPKYGSLLIEDDTELVTEVKAQGHETKDSVLRRWNGSKVKEGDVVRAWSANQNLNNFYIGSTRYNYVKNDGYAYYKVTNKGLEPILSTPLKIVPQIITTATTDAQLDSSLNDLFEEIPEGVTVDKFIEYPRRDKAGKSTGKVQVTEKSEYTQNQEVKQIYEVPYEVVSDSGPQMLTKIRDIKRGTTTSELDASIEESFEESSLNNVEYDEMEFITYPDTNELGKQNGKIKIINEVSAQGDKIDRIYDVEFNVFEPKVELTIETKDSDIPLGIDEDDIDPRDFISNVYYEGRKLKETEYSVEFDVAPFTTYIGVDDEVDIKVTLNEDDSVSEIVTSTARVLWANTLLSKDMSESKQPIMTSISLLNRNNKPKLQMTYGLFEDNRFRSRNKIDIYRENSTNELLSIEQPVGYTTTAKLMKEWQPKVDKVNLEYGDVLKQRTSDYSNTPFNGKGTFVTRDEKLVAETTNYPDAYYELTDKGYHLLQLNQLGIKNDILEFNQDTPASVVNEQASTAIEFPSHINDKTKFRFQLENVDTSKPGKYKAKMNIYEKLASGGEFMISKSVDYVVNEIPVSVELKEVEIPVGTKLEFLDPNSYVKKVVKNGKELNASEYTASFEKAPTTSKVGKSETTIKITTKEDNKSIVEKTNTKILWGDTVGSSLDGTSKTPIDASISMLHDQKKPYLVANEGTGLAVDASSGTYINVYQKSEDNAGRIFYVNPYYPKGDARKTMDVFNKAFDEQEFNYGDVIVYETRNEELVGSKLWASRNEELINESVGYNKSFYEMTKDGYRLLKANQLVVNEELLSVPLKTTHTEMNKKAAETVVFPKEVDAKDFRFEFASVDTASSGKKKTKLNIYEKLASGEEFKTIIDVEYIVNPQLSENFYDEAGKEIKTTKKTNFDLGTSYQPEPENFVSSNNEIYLYKGWLKSNEKPGTATPRSGKPSKVTKEDTVHYIYEKSEKQINMTIPTEMIFGTENGKDVTSKEYEIKNNSDKVKTEVSLNEFKKETSEVKLLTSKEKDPTKTTQSARLNLTTNGKTAVGSLNDTTKNETITTLNPGEKASMGISGNYFGSQKESARIRYNMMLKFTVVPD